MENSTTFLQDLRKIKWKSIRHAYGTSENIQTALVRLWNTAQKLKGIQSKEDKKNILVSLKKI